MFFEEATYGVFDEQDNETCYFIGTYDQCEDYQIENNLEDYTYIQELW